MMSDINKKKLLEETSNKKLVLRMLKLYDPLWKGIEEALKEKETIIIAIDGHSTSGKTTLADIIEKIYQAQIIHIDDFFRSKKQGESRSEYASNIDFERLHTEVLIPLSKHQDIQYKAFDCKMQGFTPVILKEFKQITVIEGAYATHPNISSNFDIKVFLKSSYIKQLIKVIKRNGINKLGIFIKKWIPRERAFYKQYHVEKNADYVFKS